MNRWRLRSVCFVILLLLTGLAARLFTIQIVHGFSYWEQAQKQFLKKVKEEPSRGEIVDRNGQVLATSVESQSVYIRPKELDLSADSLSSLRSALGVDAKDFENRCRSGVEIVRVARKADPLQLRALAEKRFKGVEIVSEQKRYYPNPRLACHVIGTVGTDNRGLSGIEQSFDSFLRGQSFRATQLQDRRGRKVLVRSRPAGQSEIAVDDRAGNSVMLTIDRSLQYIAEKEIRAAVEEYAAESGMALIQNPGTGEILALAACPGFDSNDLARGEVPAGFENKMLLNPSISRMFEPGSTFKVVTFSASLEEKKISLDEKFFCEKGRWKVQGATITDTEPHGILSFSEILEKSSNIGTGKIGLRVGRDLLYRYARSFGFGTRTGVALAGESEGKLRIPKKWSPVSLPVVSFGQEIGVTAIQLINAFSAIANGGVLMEPLIVKQLVHSQSGATVTTQFPPQEIRRVISPETAQIMKQILGKVVVQGSGAKARVTGYSVAGKTGTAQKIDPKTKKYYPDKYLASFCGFAPAGNPQLVCLVVLDEPKKDYWGGTTAAPVFSRIMSRAIQILGIPPDVDDLDLTANRNPVPLENKTFALSRPR